MFSKLLMRKVPVFVHGHAVTNLPSFVHLVVAGYTVQVLQINVLCGIMKRGLEMITQNKCINH